MGRRALGRVVTTLAAGGVLAVGGGVLGTTSAGATTNYGPGAEFQVEISANTNPLTFPATTDGNFWVWAALYPNGTVDYQETDCIHLSAVGIPVDAAAHDTGDGHWSITTTTLYITTVKIVGGLETATVAVPLPARGEYGHTHGLTITVTGAAPLPAGSYSYPSQNEIAH